jgi:hypothetical protein
VTVSDDHSTLIGNRQALAALSGTPLPDVPAVVAVLEEVAQVAAALSPRGEDDGIACFSRLYLRITRDVLEEYEKGALFRCGRFILDLDVAFAQRFLDAVRDDLDGGSEAPGCWALMFDRRQDEDVEPWRFAAAGVNAHVNFDLAFALLDVWEQHPETPLGTVEEQYSDYRAINTIFRNRMDELCESFDAPWTLWGDDGSLFDRAGNVLGDLLVVGTRDLAWTFAERMWRHRDERGYRHGPTALLDAVATGLARALI